MNDERPHAGLQNKEHEPHFHTVSLILFNKAGSVLMQHRSIDAPTSPGLFGLFGGHIEEGETPEHALIREVQEELGILAENYSFLETKEETHDNALVTRHLFAMPYVDGLSFTVQEGQGVRWVSLDEIETLPMQKHIREYLKMHLPALHA